MSKKAESDSPVATIPTEWWSMVYSPGNDHIATKRESRNIIFKKSTLRKGYVSFLLFLEINQDLLSEHMNHVGKYTGSLDPMVKRPAKPRNVRFLLRYQLIELAGKWTLNEDGDFPTLLKMGIFQAAMLVDSKVDSIFGKSLFKSDVSNFLPPVRKKVDRTFPYKIRDKTHLQFTFFGLFYAP